MTIENADPIEYLFIGNESQGWEGAGWYFWDETWCDCYGPYESAKKATEKLHEYMVANEMI